MSIRYLQGEELTRTLALRDLSDPAQGPHAMQELLELMHDALASHWGCRRMIHRAPALVASADNYDALGYPADGAARGTRYTRYVTPDYLLRTQTTAAVPALLRGLSIDPPDDLLLICPGLVYRRDSIDRLHSDAPHQVDLWRVHRGQVSAVDLAEMVRQVMQAALPGHAYRLLPADHPYTVHGMQLDVRLNDEWVEVGECGLIDPELLRRCGLDSDAVSGLAMGLGLDRLLMLRKGIPDIRLLRATDPRIAAQMLDLDPYRAVSNQPAIQRDLSLALREGATVEELGDRVRETLPHLLTQLESLDIIAATPATELPPTAAERLGMMPGQCNVLLRLTIRDPVRSLTQAEANRLRDEIYAVLHEGRRHEWATAVSG